MANVIGYYNGKEQEAFENTPEGHFLLKTDEVKRIVTYAPKVTDEDTRYHWEKRDIYYRGGGRKIYMGSSKAHSVSWENLQERLNVWTIGERHRKSLYHTETILKCSYETAASNYGDLYNEFHIHVLPYWDIEAGKYSDNLYCARAYLDSCDDGGWGCWSKPATLEEAKRYANRIKNYIQALQKPFDYNDFRKFVESEGHEFDHG